MVDVVYWFWVKTLNKYINKPNGIDVISGFKRASSILESELERKVEREEKKKEDGLNYIIDNLKR